MDNNTCINCSHEKVCKYKDELDKKIKELNVFDGKEDPLFTLLRLSLSCGFYKSENPMLKVKTAEFPINEMSWKG